MKQITVLLASLLLVSTPLAGCLDDVEELIDDIVGCMDAEAKNYDENATTALVGDCIYAASMQTFVDSMAQQMSIEELLDQSSSAGYSLSTMMEMEGDMALESGEPIIMSVQETVKVNLSSNSAYVSQTTNIASMLTVSTTIIQVGEIVNVHNELTGAGLTEMGSEEIDESYQTRDESPNVLEWVLPMIADGMLSGDDDEDGDINGDGINDGCPFEWENSGNPCGAEECNG